MAMTITNEEQGLVVRIEAPEGATVPTALALAAYGVVALHQDAGLSLIDMLHGLTMAWCESTGKPMESGLVDMMGHTHIFRREGP